MRHGFAIVWLALLLPLGAAERRFDFGEVAEGAVPPGFRSALTGRGRPGEWKVVMDTVPSQMQSVTGEGPALAKRAVLAQVSTDPTDERFPLLIYEGEKFNDFTFSTRFKAVSGVMEQMAGLAFRIQNETNYYVLRASALGGTFRFYKVVNGERGNLIGPELKIPGGVWHELSVECKGNQIRCFLNGQQAIPTLNDNTFPGGKVGFWTKSDSVSYFVDAKVVYTPVEPPAQKLVDAAVKDYGRVLDVQVFVRGPAPDSTRLIANKARAGLDVPGSDSELETLKDGAIFYGKTNDTVSVMMPVRDRNGEPVAAVRVLMKRVAGQTRDSAIVRATPIVKQIQARVHGREDLIDE